MEHIILGIFRILFWHIYSSNVQNFKSCSHPVPWNAIYSYFSGSFSTFLWSFIFSNSCMICLNDSLISLDLPFPFGCFQHPVEWCRILFDHDVGIHLSFLHSLHLKLKLVGSWTTWTTLIIFVSSFLHCLFWGDGHSIYVFSIELMLLLL